MFTEERAEATQREDEHRTLKIPLMWQIMLRTGESLNLLVGLWWEWSSANYMLNVDSVKYITDCFFFFFFLSE